jgi:hypothetical protein
MPCWLAWSYWLFGPEDVATINTFNFGCSRNTTGSLLWGNISNKILAPLSSDLLNVVKAPFTYLYTIKCLCCIVVKVIETNNWKKIVNYKTGCDDCLWQNVDPVRKCCLQTLQWACTVTLLRMGHDVRRNRRNTVKFSSTLCTVSDLLSGKSSLN